MKILHINCADFGSTGKIIKDISRKAQEDGHLSFLLTPKKNYEEVFLHIKATSFPHEQGAYLRLVKLFGFKYGFAPVSTFRILSNIKKIKPDVVHLHSINCNMVNIYRLVKFLKKRKIPTVVTNHAEFFYTGSCDYAYSCEKWKTGCGGCENYKKACGTLWDSSASAWKKMQYSFKGVDKSCIVSVSPYVFNRSVKSPIFDGIQQKTILNGINTEVFYRHKEIKDDIKKYNAKKVVVAVTAQFDPAEESRKGGVYLVDLARRFENDDVNFLVIGNTVKRDVVLPNNLKVVGKVMNQDDLAQYYSMADVSVITSSRETFSMPVAESLACGTPVVGFLAGGPESIAIEEYCKFVEFGDVDSMEKALREEWLNKKQNLNPDSIMRKAHKKYSSVLMATLYLNTYEEVIKANG